MDHHHNHFVQKVSRLFPSSFTSCQFRTVPDIIDSSISIPKTTQNILHHQIQINGSSSNQEQEPFSNLQKNPFLIQSQNPKIPNNHDNKLFKNFEKSLKCPPVTPVSVLASEQSMKKKKNPKESSNKNFNNNNNCSSSNYSGWFSSGGESDAFFSLSSGSSESFRLKTANSSHRFDYKTTEIGRCSSGISAKSAKTANSSRRFDYKNTEIGRCSSGISAKSILESNKNPSRKHTNYGRNHTQFVKENEILKGCEESSTGLYYGKCRKTAKSGLKTGETRRRRKNAPPVSGGDSGEKGIVKDGVEESYAVEKISDDPRSDFRKSMVEMIIEKQIFGAKDLEKLLHCFLSLNSPNYHKIIVEVFTEICDTLFTNF